MIAGTLAKLEEPVDEPFESRFSGEGLPALYVEETQDSFDERPVQSGTAADATETERRVPMVLHDNNGDPASIITEKERHGKKIASDWVADPTGTGLLVAESLDGNDRHAFPLDMLAGAAGERVQLLEIDVTSMFTAWESDDDGITEVSMKAAEDEDSVSIEYHEAAEGHTEPTIGFGFSRPWSNRVYSGVVWDSGYVAVYNTDVPSNFVRFVEEQILPYAEAVEDPQQQLISDRGGSDDDGEEFADEVAAHLDTVDYDVERDPDAGGGS